MTVIPSNEMFRLYERVSKLKPSLILEKEPAEPEDIVNISTEAKKKQVLEQTRSEVLDKIRQAK
ncbi:MAG: hypothetical protein WC539_10570 [Nitrospirota bacterium]